ncbi:MAG: response regulator [Treponema sp.]|nr:response regulator [Treponema sp.]
MNKIDTVRQTFLQETMAVMLEIKKDPRQTKRALDKIKFTKDMAHVLGFHAVYKLYRSLENVYIGIADKEIAISENIFVLINVVCDKIIDVCRKIADGNDDIDDLGKYILYCDKAAAGEIFDTDVFLRRQTVIEKDLSDDKASLEKIISVQVKDVGNVLNVHEEMIARTYKMSGVIEAMKDQNRRLTQLQISEFTKQLLSELQLLQNSLLIAHDKVLNMVKDDSTFAEKHQDVHGFFVYANGHKCMIPSEHIVDVTYDTSLNYVTQQNQLYLEREEDEQVVYIPIYSLSSLFPGQKAVEKNSLDTIFIAGYMGQRVGIIVDKLQTSVSIVKNILPKSFKNFKILQGICFDEKYDMIPVLYIPEILKRFRSLRGYDVKKFEAKTQLHIYKVLVVDDSQTTRQIVAGILGTNGFMVDEAVDGINAMEMVKSRQYDLIVTDDVMPRMNGEIFLDNLRQMANYVEVPVLVMAAKPIEKGNAFISKADFKRGDLIQKIKDLLHE